MISYLSWKAGSNTLDELFNIRKAYREFERKNQYSQFDLYAILSRIIENDLIRKLNAEPLKLDPTEKEKLESDIIKYKNQAESIYKWFCYYQDKCKILEKKTGKFVIPDFPDEEFPTGSGPLGF